MKESISKIVSSIKEQVVGNQQPQQPVKPQAYVVVFDKGQEGEFKAKFSERGFLIDGTRLSFEAIEDALSKDYHITLGGGQGVVLDAVRMQKILKYKNRWISNT